jgi:hypothetical protein
MNLPQYDVPYIFAHQALPGLILKKPGDFFKGLERDPNDLIQYLWTSLERDVNRKYPFGRPTCARHAIASNCTIFFVKMPEPKSVPDAAFIGIVVWVESGFFQDKFKNLRYVTVELALNITRPGASSYMLCEWKSPNDHVNYGQIKDGSQQTALGAIEALVMGREIPHPAPSAPAPQERSRVQTAKDPFDEIEQEEKILKPVWDRWIDQVPEPLLQQAMDSASGVQKMFQVLVGSIKFKYAISDQKVDNYMETARKATSRLASLSLFLGIEFGKERPFSSSVEISLDQLDNETRNLLRMAGDTAALVITP